MRIGILGGTFDPIHKGHIKLAKKALSKLKLDKVLIMPAGNPYFKTSAYTVTAGAHRAKLIRLAIMDEEGLELSDIELSRQGKTYTADTLLLLNNKNPHNKYYFIMGADSFNKIDSWRSPETIFELASIVVAGRDDQIKDKALDEKIEQIRSSFNADIIKLKWKGYKASSTDIRKKLKKGNYNVPLCKAEIDYIKAAGLYKDKLTLSEIKTRFKAELKPSRYIHSLGVADVAKDLAYIYGYFDPKKAYLTGLIHDCGKPYADDLSHAGVGADIAASQYMIEDEEILSAIRSHTIGKVNMSLLEKIIFIADFIEPSRHDFPELASIRATAYEDIDKAVFMALKSTRLYLKSQGKSIDEESVKVYNYYLDLMSK